MRKLKIISAAVLLTLPAGCGGPSGTPPTAAATQSTAAATYQSRWWTWANSESEATNPVVDRTGEFCARNQPTDVWFLAGTFGGKAERACAIPASRPIIVPIVNSVSPDQAGCDDFMPSVAGTAQLDGAAIRPEVKSGEPIEYRTVAGSPHSDTAETYEGIGCGWWLRIEPLASGRHTLAFEGSSGEFSTRVTYVLTVG